jgi:hypothetical protein
MPSDEHQRIPMHYLIIEAVQDPMHRHEEEYAGASVGCWIKNQTRKNACLIAKGWIEEHGWVVLSLEDQQVVSEGDYTDKSEGREYFEQALVDEQVFVFNTWPKHEKA